ncbi:MAG: amidohydrolase family protein [Rhodoferax sp.]|nr:amidohydrolase family protein [Rhodoferax sp.]
MTFAQELNRLRSVTDATYADALARFGERTVMELTALVGYYTMVAMTLNAHEILARRRGAGVRTATTPVTMNDSLNAAPQPPAATPITGWDCHAHLFGPYDCFPLAPQRSYTPPEAVEAQYLAMLARLGLSHGVLVHPSAYGEDFSLLLHALASRPQLRGVIVANKGMDLDWSSLRACGVRAARFSHRSGAGANFAGSASLDDLHALAPRLADAGLHAELWTDCQVLPDIAEQLRQMPVPVVIDHTGGFDVAAGVDAAGFRCLLSLVESGHVWSSCVPTATCWPCKTSPWADLFTARCSRQIRSAWSGGTDWPHLRVTPEPDTSALLALFKDWTGDKELVHKILVTNPTALYD